MNFVTPSGFRDVLSDEALVRERVVHAVQQVFQLECFLFEVNADVLCSTSCIFSREYHSHALLYLL